MHTKWCINTHKDPGCFSPATEHLRQIVFCYWPCGGSPVQSEQAGPSAPASCEAGGEGGPRRGGGTAGVGGDGLETSACGWT